MEQSSSLLPVGPHLGVLSPPHSMSMDQGSSLLPLGQYQDGSLPTPLHNAVIHGAEQFHARFGIIPIP